MAGHPPETATDEPASGAYQFLAGRAGDLLASRDRPVPEDEIIRHVFGGGNPDLWRSLLAPVMAEIPGAQRYGDATWGFPREAPLDLRIDEFVAIDVETTGLRPYQHRVIDIALVRYREGQPVDRFVSLCRPDRRIPAYITKLTGLRDDDLVGAPAFPDIAAQVVEFIGGSTLVGHNVSFDIGFINAELKRCGRQTLLNDALDTLGLGMRLLTQVRRPSLDRLAAAVGLAGRDVHRAERDADLAAQVLVRLAAIAHEQGITDIAGLRALASNHLPRPKDGMARGRAVLDRSHLESLPQQPGVYLMRDRTGRVIYVGKAKNLRDRVSSYYSQPLGYTRKMDGLLESIDRIDHHVTGSELDALMLESQLIRRYNPRFNTALRNFEAYPYIRVGTDSPWPRISLARQPKEDGATWFGPFRSGKAARSVVDLLNDHFGLRTCPRSFRNARSYGAPCLRLDLGKCSGPCMGQVDRDAYLEQVRQAMRFLEGDEAVLHDRIWEQLEESATNLDFERARRLRGDIRMLLAVASASRNLRKARERERFVLVLPSATDGAIEVLLVSHGRTWARFTASRGDGATDLAGRLERSWTRLASGPSPRIDHVSLDEASILMRWVDRHHGAPFIFHLGDGAEIDWHDLASRALDLRQEDFAFQPVPDDDPLDGEDDSGAGEDVAEDADGDGGEGPAWGAHLAAVGGDSSAGEAHPSVY